MCETKYLHEVIGTGRKVKFGQSQDEINMFHLVGTHVKDALLKKEHFKWEQTEE